jgi:DNA-binding MarR family transcriptional regulator
MDRNKVKASPARPSPRAQLLRQLEQAVRAHATTSVLFHNALAQQNELSGPDQRTVELLARVGPLTAGQLGEKTGLKPASVTALVDRLEKKGFVQRSRDPNDRRRVFVAASPGGAARLVEIYGKLPPVDLMLRRYSLEQLETILDFLQRSASSANEVISLLAKRSR